MQINNVTCLLRLETHLDLDQAGTIGFCILLYYTLIICVVVKEERKGRVSVLSCMQAKRNTKLCMYFSVIYHFLRQSFVFKINQQQVVCLSSNF